MEKIVVLVVVAVVSTVKIAILSRKGKEVKRKQGEDDCGQKEGRKERT